MGITTAVVVAGIPLVFGARTIADATISTPTTLATLETDKAQPSRLAWSADGTQLYVQTFEGTFLELNQGTAKKIKHYVFSTTDGSKKEVESEPDWARAYWGVKAGKAAPDNAAFAIDIKEETRTQRSASTPMGGDLAKGGVEGGGRGEAGAGAAAGDVNAAALGSQRVLVRNMVLKGEVIGTFENTVIVPGLTYGWGPKGSHSVAYAMPKGGRVVIMNDQGTKTEIAGTKDALLPAWSSDGKRLAWLQKDGKKKYQLQVASVSGS